MLKKLLGFNGRPCVELENLIDTRPFSEIDEEVTLALMHSSQLRAGTGGIYDSAEAGAKQFLYPTDFEKIVQSMSARQRETFESLAEKVPEHDQRRAHHQLSTKQKQYLKFAMGVYFSWQNNLTILGSNSFTTKHKPTQTIHEETARILKRTIDYVYSLPFESIGRVVLFGVDPLCVVPTHRDSEIDYNDKAYAEFLNFSPGRFKKRFYVYDNATDQKHYTHSKAYWFNELDYHGVDPQPHFTYSIRIDGVYKAEFRERILQAYPDLNLVPPNQKSYGT